MTIAACYPRAVRWLFSSAGAPLDKERVAILNMREETAETVTDAMLNRKTESRSSTAEVPAGNGGNP